MKFRGPQQIVLFAAVATTLFMVGCDKTELADVHVQDEINGDPVDGQYIVVLHTDVAERGSQASEASVRLRSARLAEIKDLLVSELNLQSIPSHNSFDGVITGFTAALTPKQADALRKRPEVAFIEPDRFITLARPGKQLGEIKVGEANPLPEPVAVKVPYTTITPLSGDHVPWNVERVGYGDGTGRTVWVIDSGVDTDNPDLNVDLARSKSFIYGVTSVEDGYGHGTRVAGIIAAKNNGSGMIGVASNATVVALRVFDDAGKGTTSRVVTAVNYIVQNGTPGDVINISLGGGISSTLDEAVEIAAAKGFKFAIAAGNSGSDCSSTSPARLNAPNVYTISAVNNYNQLWENSNYGAPVDYAAPGVNITSIERNGTVSTGSNGTSYAAPHVAGILLLRPDIITQGTVTGDKDTTAEPVASAR